MGLGEVEIIVTDQLSDLDQDQEPPVCRRQALADGAALVAYRWTDCVLPVGQWEGWSQARQGLAGMGGTALNAVDF